MAGVDLHVHSTASDGKFSPTEIVRMAVAQGLTVMALTDHDTIDGIPQAVETARVFPHFTLVPAVELSTDTSNGEVHVLGYFIDYTNEEFKSSLDRMRNSRTIRAEKMLAKLKTLGCDIEWERVKAIAGEGALGRAHIAQALLEKGYINSFKEAFTKYIGHGCPAYMNREKLTPTEAVKLILKANGFPVFAHPFTSLTPEAVIKELKTAGLIGMEVYYAGYLPTETSTLLNFAIKYDLIPTGGTDFHGIDITSEVRMGGTDVPMRFVEQLINLAKQRGSKTNLAS